MPKISRRIALARGGQAIAVAAAFPVVASVAASSAEGQAADAKLLHAVNRWHQLQAQISALATERKERETQLPEKFRRCSIDPRGWCAAEWTKELPEAPNKFMSEYELFYIQAGLGEIEDRREDLWEVQDPITDRLLAAKPVTSAGAIALTTVCVAILGSEGDPKDDWLVKVTDVAKRSLSEAARLAGRAS